ncbi:hypothetical protein [Pseudobacillus badius]|uniref:hypothetical protein n=1 Tax=Bacillus badius TaxID=1455 RepID=UPI003D351D7A
MADHFLELRDDLKTMKEIQEALAEPFPENILDQQENGYWFIPVERVKERLITVVGVDAFDVEYSDIRHHEEDWITCTCTITVDFSKWNGRIKKVSQDSGLKIARHNKNEEKLGQIVDLGSAYKSVKSAAFSKAAQELGIGLYLQLEKKNDQSRQNNKGYQSNQKGKNSSNNEASDGQKKAIYAMEKRLALDPDKKNRLLTTLFSSNAKQAATKPTYNQADKYIGVLKPVCDIMDIVKHSPNSKEMKGMVFNSLSQHFQKKINSYVGLLTLVTPELVDDLKKSFTSKVA